MSPLALEKASAFGIAWRESVASGERVLLIAEDGAGIIGTVQLILDQPENQPHRADLSKMLVHRRARRRGGERAILRAAEDARRASLGKIAASTRHREQRC